LRPAHPRASDLVPRLRKRAETIDPRTIPPTTAASSVTHPAGGVWRTAAQTRSTTLSDPSAARGMLHAMLGIAVKLPSV
jgi:hypothetical protein